MSAQPKYSLFNGDYQVLTKLGEGISSKVYHGRRSGDDGLSEDVAIKVIQPEFLKNKGDAKYVESEISVLKQLDHPNIVKFVEAGSTGFVRKPSGGEIGGINYLLTEMVQGQGLFEICQTHKAFGEEGARYFMHQLVDVLVYLHGKGLCHRDIKLENILMTDDLQLKLIDFGFASKNVKGKKLESYVGTNTYMAPQVRNRVGYDGQSADIFSVGVLLFIMACGTFPFLQGMINDQYYKYIFAGRFQDYFKKVQASEFSPEFKDLFLRMVSYEEKNRITLEQLVNHPWMTRPFNSEQAKISLMKKFR